MNVVKYLTAVVAGVALLIGGAVGASAESTLEIVKKRGHLRCQVGPPSPGFYNLDAEGNWYGSDVDTCRAIAAAIFGDANAVQFQSVSTQARFTAMANGESDVLSRTTTWTLLRDSQLGLDFTAINFYDGQGFMVPKDSGITSAFDLKGASVCVLTGTTTELNLADFSRNNSLDIQPITFEDGNVRNDTYLQGGCDALTNDKSGLASNKAAFPNPNDHIILPETISKEPLGPVVRQNDSQWMDIVKWTVFAMIAAEELGLTSTNVDEAKANMGNASVNRLLGTEGNLGEGLGLPADWAYQIVKQVGNYDEMYERSMGDGPRAIGIGRAGSQNDLWTRGGLQYSPPFR
ncbi:MAG: amino acid ABC transporter substrate-binding protein [Proteobacteria bacterium]|nr:amino acid ABC transporter substrate-binding protein [Pseudomonadota bacterium]